MYGKAESQEARKSKSSRRRDMLYRGNSGIPQSKCQWVKREEGKGEDSKDALQSQISFCVFENVV